MTGINMKKIALICLSAFCFLNTSCMWLEPGYWQMLGEMFDRGTEVSSMPDYSEKFTWEQITKDEAQEIWNTDIYRKNLKNPPATVNIYQKNKDGAIRKYSGVQIDKFPNWIYSRTFSEYIYAVMFNSELTEENSVYLNKYIPSNIPEGTVIYKAKDDDSYVKMLVPYKYNDYETNEVKDTKETLIFKNALVIQRIIMADTFVEY